MTNKEYIDYLRVCGKLNIQDKKTIEIINCIEEFDISICNILKHIINIPTIIERRIVLGGLLDLISDIDDNKQNIESIEYIIDTLEIFVRDCTEYIVTNNGSDAIDSTINNIRECINNKYTMKELEDEFNRSRIIRPSKSIKIECNKIRYKLTVCYNNDTEYLKNPFLRWRLLLIALYNIHYLCIKMRVTYYKWVTLIFCEFLQKFSSIICA